MDRGACGARGRGTASRHTAVSFFFNDTATTEIYTLSLHDALPICPGAVDGLAYRDALTGLPTRALLDRDLDAALSRARSEEHTSELQSRQYLVCRLLLEKKKSISKPASSRVSPPSTV